MRTLEIILALILLFRIAVLLVNRDHWVEWVSVAALGVMGLHLWLEGYRWQMIPLYGIAVGLGIFSIWRLTRSKSKNGKLTMGSFGQIIGSLLILGIAILPPILLPVPKTPEPTGPYAVSKACPIHCGSWQRHSNPWAPPVRHCHRTAAETDSLDYRCRM